MQWLGGVLSDVMMVVLTIIVAGIAEQSLNDSGGVKYFHLKLKALSLALD